MRIALVIAAAALAYCGSLQAQEQREFYSGYIGTLPQAAEDRAKTFFNRHEVSSLLDEIENGEVTEAQAERRLIGTNTRLSDLKRLHLLRVDSGLMRIDFPYFTARDMKAIHSVAAKYVPGLVSAYRASAGRMNAILQRYPVKSVSSARLGFVLLAGFALNWDALDLLTEEGYRQPLTISGNGWHYGFWAAEAVPGFSYAGYYWGSSSFPAGQVNLKPPLDFTFSSFGDADSDPRMNLPDLLGLPPAQMTPPVRAAAELLGLRDDDALGEPMKNVIGPSRARSIGEVLFAVRSGVDTKAAICVHISDASQCEAILELLSASGYLRLDSTPRYVLTVPVLGESDEATVRSFLRLSRGILNDWLKHNYKPMQRELDGLTAVRQGVPYPVLFSQIWHELFGQATRDLAVNGVIENPRAPNATWNGSVPVVWRTRIYRHEWQ
jgi:hypothetical protein